MLSILVPIYNVEVKKMITSLLEQCKKAGVDYEVICFDDKSRKAIRNKNRAALQHLFKVNYVELSENIGRAKIRNWLAKAANGGRLLFLDCDSKIIRKDFIKTYLNQTAPVVYGGRVYAKRKANDNFTLHWEYGHRYESKEAEERSKLPYESFMSNNFLIDAALFNEVGFNEDILGYGYEDLVLAQDIKDKGIKILHIDNPVEHRFIDKNEVFMDKVDRSLINLQELYQQEKIQATKLLRWTSTLKKWKLGGLVQRILTPRLGQIRKDLIQNKRPIRWLQIYKLGKYLSQSNLK